MTTSRTTHEYSGVQYTVEVTWTVEEELLSSEAGKLRCTQVTVSLADATPDADITSRVLRSIPVSKLTAEADRARRRYLAVLARHPEPTPDGTYYHVWAGKPQPLPRTAGQRGRPRYYKDEHYQEVARIYSAAAAAGEAPVKAVAAAINTTPRAASKLVSNARKAGYLPKTSRGRVAGGDV